MIILHIPALQSQNYYLSFNDESSATIINDNEVKCIVPSSNITQIVTINLGFIHLTSNSESAIARSNIIFEYYLTAVINDITPDGTLGIPTEPLNNNFTNCNSSKYSIKFTLIVVVLRLNVMLIDVVFFSCLYIIVNCLYNCDSILLLIVVSVNVSFIGE